MSHSRKKIDGHENERLESTYMDEKAFRKGKKWQMAKNKTVFAKLWIILKCY